MCFSLSQSQFSKLSPDLLRDGLDNRSKHSERNETNVWCEYYIVVASIPIDRPCSHQMSKLSKPNLTKQIRCKQYVETYYHLLERFLYQNESINVSISGKIELNIHSSTDLIHILSFHTGI